MARRAGALLAVWLACCAAAAEAKSSCDVCTRFVDKFKEGMARTTGKSSGSGNTDWEESRGIRYATSEARLAEVLETVCERSDIKCIGFLEEHEEWVEQWFVGREISLSRMRTLLCVDEAKCCCKEGHFGKKCKACPGGSETPCSGHGTCRGAGDRKGKGTCKCDAGYIGKRCAKCAPLFFKDGVNGTDCSACDQACAKGCTGPNRTQCLKCAAGWEMDAGAGGCVDVDECAAGGAGDCSATPGTFCSNTDSNYTCEKCDPSCHPDDGCTGPTSADCAERSCADGYQWVDETGCTDVNECESTESVCKEDQFCVNLAGSHECKECSLACATGAGCTDSTPLGCRGCADGYRVPEGRDAGCEDVDECAAADGACNEGFACVNTPGSFECQCQAPRAAVDGVCRDPEPASNGRADSEGSGEEAGTAEAAKDEL